MSKGLTYTQALTYFKFEIINGRSKFAGLTKNVPRDLDPKLKLLLFDTILKYSERKSYTWYNRLYIPLSNFKYRDYELEWLANEYGTVPSPKRYDRVLHFIPKHSNNYRNRPLATEPKKFQFMDEYLIANYGELINELDKLKKNCKYRDYFYNPNDVYGQMDHYLTTENQAAILYTAIYEKNFDNMRQWKREPGGTDKIFFSGYIGYDKAYINRQQKAIGIKRARAIKLFYKQLMEIHYRPGGRGYYKAKSHFESLSK